MGKRWDVGGWAACLPLIHAVCSLNRWFLGLRCPRSLFLSSGLCERCVVVCDAP